MARQYDNRGRLTSEVDTGYGGGTSVNLYSYTVPSGGYAHNGNIHEHIDSVTGTWIYYYDSADRLVTARNTATGLSGNYANMYGCWSYDPYGNRTGEMLATGAAFTNGYDATCAPGSGATIVSSVLNSYVAGNNRISSSTRSPSTLTANSYIYDVSGNTLWDGINQYWYDAEGQLCAEQTGGNGGAITAYVYDAGGARIAKGSLTTSPGAYSLISAGLATSLGCAPPSASGAGLTSGNGFTLTARYLVDLGGQQATEFNTAVTGTSALGWAHSNVVAGGKLVGTYDSKGLHYELADPLGTKRVQANIAGQMDEYCVSLPFGNDLNNPMTASCTQVPNGLKTSDDATEHHFTGKERDTESGNDYFGARYYASSMGRFMSPDWSAKVAPVPYAKLDNPQSLNLYSYMLNNPLKGTDPDGHDGSPCSGSTANGGCTYTKNEKTNTMTVTETNNSITQNKDSNGNVTSVTQTTTATKTTVSMGDNPAVTGATVTTNTVTMHTDGSPDTRTSNADHPEVLSAGQAMDRMGDDRTAQLQFAAQPGFFQNIADHPVTTLGIVGGTIGTVACIVAEPCGAVAATGIALGGGAVSLIGIGSGK